MAPPPRFDHDEARELYAAGVSRKEMAERYGVTVQAVYRVTAPADVRAKERAYLRSYQSAHRTPCANGCGRVVYGQYCRICWAETRRTSVRENTLQCGNCRDWKADKEFPRSRNEPQRRRRHKQCRACCTALRREYRERNKVPCSHGCGTMVLHENGGKDPECHPCAVARIHGQRVAA